MKSLIKLSLLKIRGQIRALFSKPSSAITTIAIVLLYGAIVVGNMMSGEVQTAMGMTLDIHIAVLVSLGMTALMVLMQLLNKNKAMLMGEDAFYLLGGPFTRRQVQSFVVGYTYVQAIYMSLLSLFVVLSIVGGAGWTVLLYIFIANYLIYVIFLALTDYFYVLGIVFPKRANVAKYVAYGLIVCLFAVAGYLVYQTGFDMQSAALTFAQGRSFYFVPVFGWAKMFISGAVDGQVFETILGLGLLVGAAVIVFILFRNFPYDYHEQAIEDSFALSQKMKSAKKGNMDALRDTSKLKQYNSSFAKGAWAISSKLILEMRKRKTLVSIQELITLAVFAGMSIILEFGIVWFSAMLIYWVVISAQSANFKDEFQNYMIYLIPDSPAKKLLAIIGPVIVKTTIVTTLAIIIVGIAGQESMYDIVYAALMVFGYLCVCISANILTLRLFKSTANRTFVLLMQMLIIVVCMIPSIALSVWLVFTLHIGDGQILQLFSIVSIVSNVVVAGVVIFLCRNMLNGRELKSE